MFSLHIHFQVPLCDCWTPVSGLECPYVFEIFAADPNTADDVDVLSVRCPTCDCLINRPVPKTPISFAFGRGSHIVFAKPSRLSMALHTQADGDAKGPDDNVEGPEEEGPAF